jgi:hypothetical protein
MNTIDGQVLPLGCQSLGAETQPGLARAGLRFARPRFLFTRREAPAIFGKASMLVTRRGAGAFTNDRGAPR